MSVREPASAAEAERLARMERRMTERARRRDGSGGASLWSAPWGRTLVAAVAVLAVATVVGLVVLWPGAARPDGASQAMGGTTLGATVTGSELARCQGPTRQRCR